MRFDHEVNIQRGRATTLEVLDKHLFTRIIRSLLSEQDLDAIEPYECWNEAGKSVSSKKAIMAINTLPVLPFDDRKLLNRLYEHIQKQIELDPSTYELLNTTGNQLLNILSNFSNQTWSSYACGLDWQLEVFLKAFGFAPVQREEQSFLENCIRFLEFCVDIEVQQVLVFVGIKSFLTPNELNELLNQIDFLGNEVLFIESTHDELFYEKENKIVIDQDLISWE
ncbi:MAG: type II-A CRISPR-associated protein Csn2 [Coriobacteriales bacterium]|nr:type II-A CRISPR-associated protein Csn2 [Coriobacteriales bacterium]